MEPTVKWGKESSVDIWTRLKENLHFIKFIKNPNVEMQKYVIDQDPFMFQWIDNPHDEIQKEILKKNGKFIQFIPNPTEEMQVIALQSNPGAITFIKELERKAILEVFSSYSEEKVKEWTFDKVREDPLLYALEEEDKREFSFVIREYYKEELQQGPYFQSLFQYLVDFHADWIEEFLEEMMPLTTEQMVLLTKEQEDIWKQFRLKAIF